MKIGFIGLGVMGEPMAANLVKAGHELLTCNRRPKSIPGSTAVASPADAARHRDIVFSMLPATADVEQVLFGEGGVAEALPPGAVFIDMSTISPVASMEFARRLASRSISMLDAPVSGGDIGARNGTLSIMAGGEREVYERCLPVLRSLGSNIIYAGPSGSGQKTKLVNQVVAALNLLGAVEGLRLAAAAGLDLDATLQAVASGAAGSWMWANLGKKIAAGDFSAGFTIRLQQKDLRLAREFFEQLGLDAPGTALTAALFTQALEKGLGTEGNQALYRLWE